MEEKVLGLPETSHALKARLIFVWETLCQIRPLHILDIGCGTGEQVTQYVSRLFPSSKVVGFDSDARSIDFAQKKFSKVSNLRFTNSLPEDPLFDAIIASEVLEHVENPYEFLLLLRSRLIDDGVLIITLPNGYGCSEMMELLETLLRLSGIYALLKKGKQAVWKNPKSGGMQDTLAISPHINFFTLRKLNTVLSESGFHVIKYQGRMFLHNFICSTIIDRSELLSRYNALLGRILPAFLVSDWMFSLKKKDERVERKKVYKRSVYERIKRYLNYKRSDMKP